MEVGQGSGCPKPYDKRVQDWSNDELFDLLQNIKSYGSRDISSIAKSIPTKTTEQIKKAIEYYRDRAIATVSGEPVKKNIWNAKSKTNRPPVPLRSWAKFLKDSYSSKELHTETATAVKFISEFENIPPAKQTNNIDFRNIYHCIAEAMEGKTIPDDTAMAAVLNKCVVETALTSKAFMRTGALQNVVQWIDLSDKAIRVLPRPTDKVELATLRHLASQKAYNPLNIPEQHLKPT